MYVHRHIGSLLGGSGWEKEEVDEGNEGEASAVPTTMRPMEEERRKAMSRRMMREKERGKGN